MKRFYSLLLFLLAASCTFAQQNVSLRINHKLGAAAFQMGTQAINNLGNEFTVSRLQYYIAEITLVHDGGQETMVPDTWFLVDAGRSFEEPLGSFAITSLEGIKFGVGVQSAYNHLDPSSYPSLHPLAPKSPSMHWGWSSGYLFVAFEGNSGANLAEAWELHALDDDNYFQTNITTAGTMNGQDLIVDLDGDYVMALKDIDVSTGPISHSGTGLNVTMMQNFRDFVFSAALATRVEVPEKTSSFSISPNPSAGPSRLLLNPALAQGASFVVYDQMGRVLRRLEPVAGVADLDMQVAGCYMVALQRDGHTVATKRMVIAH